MTTRTTLGLPGLVFACACAERQPEDTGDSEPVCELSEGEFADRYVYAWCASRYPPEESAFDTCYREHRELVGPECHHGDYAYDPCRAEECILEMEAALAAGEETRQSADCYYAHLGACPIA